MISHFWLQFVRDRPVRFWKTLSEPEVRRHGDARLRNNAIQNGTVLDQLPERHEDERSVDHITCYKYNKQHVEDKKTAHKAIGVIGVTQRLQLWQLSFQLLGAWMVSHEALAQTLPKSMPLGQRKVIKKVVEMNCE